MLFLDTRTERRAACGMSAADIHDEAEYEWLEGMAQAMLLDKLDSSWKSSAFSDTFTFEDALAAAASF